MAWKLLFEDRFQYEGRPDPTIWTLETGGHGFGNNEAQFYTDRLDNAYVKDGTLYIVAKKEQYEHRSYTSAKLTTYGKKHIKYGRVEVMAKLPKGHGTWPAIWFLGENFKEIGWPTCGEIDLVEHVGHNPDQIHFSLHSKLKNFSKNTQLTEVVKIKEATDRFHEYAIEWDDKHIAFFIDGTCLADFKKQPGETEETWPFDQGFYLILNIALGGIWGGPIDDSIFPQTMQFQYVRVYERSDS